MREIKFRAWNVATKTMIDLKKVTPLALNMDTDGLFIPFSDGLLLMQFTGLLDKNGKEIYDQDKVKTPRGVDKVFMRLGCWFVENQQELGYFEPYDVEVIDTPHLLAKGGDDGRKKGIPYPWRL